MNTNWIRLRNNARLRVSVRTLAMASMLGLSTFTLTGCNDAQAGLLLGSGIGALTGQAIGGDTCSTLLGLGIGSSVGYIIGNESDKDRYQRHGHYDWHGDEYRHRDCGYSNYDY